MSDSDYFKLEINQTTGANLTSTFTEPDETTPIDLTGASARCQLRENYDSREVLLELTSSNGGLVMGGTSGTITIVVTPDQASGMTVKAGVYDIILTMAGRPLPYIQGKFTVNRTTTRV